MTLYSIAIAADGGKMTTVFGVALQQAIQNKQIQMNFKGVALG